MLIKLDDKTADHVAERLSPTRRPAPRRAGPLTHLGPRHRARRPRRVQRRHRRRRLLLRPALTVATRHQRELERPRPPVPPQRHRPVRPHPGRPRRHRRTPQRTTPQDPRDGILQPNDSTSLSRPPLESAHIFRPQYRHRGSRGPSKVQPYQPRHNNAVRPIVDQSARIAVPWRWPTGRARTRRSVARPARISRGHDGSPSPDLPYFAGWPSRLGDRTGIVRRSAAPTCSLRGSPEPVGPSVADESGRCPTRRGGAPMCHLEGSECG